MEFLDPRLLLAATPAWAAGIGGNSIDAIADIATDRSGNVYLAGMFRAEMDADPSKGGATILRAAANAQPYGFVAKYTVAGALLWARPLNLKGLGDVAVGELQAIAVDRAGAVYLSGHFDGTVDFDPSKAGTSTLTTAADDAFVTKWDAGGNFVWATRLPSTRGVPVGANAPALAFGGGADLFVGGEMISQGDELDGAPFLARLDRATGAVGFVHDMIPDLPSINKIGNALATDRAGNVVVAGAQGSSSGGASFAAKYDRTGALLWASEFAGGSSPGSTGVAVDNRGSVFLAGSFGGQGQRTTFDFDPGPGQVNLTPVGGADAYVMRLTAGGGLVWVRQLGGPAVTLTGDVRRDALGNVVVGGTFGGAVDFDPRRGQFVLDAGDTPDLFVATLTPTGNFVSAFAIGGRRAVVTPASAQLWIDRSGHLLVGATFTRDVDADPGAGELLLSSNGRSADVLFGRYVP
ncbi:MAG TPA: hypothetical protein VEA69_11375 [Tepidisphaeraceae bacterium]|nr:hypothetical protein [Tepidisphaeraceae bacterium]